MSLLCTLLFAAEEGHSWVSMRGALPRQPVGGLDEEPGQIAQANWGPEGHRWAGTSTFRL